jgi:nitrite reductase/ring-hydroxylating ferredoxin subunit
MKRDEFLNTISRGLILVCAGSCVVACSSSDDGGTTPTPSPPPASGSKVSVAISRMPNVGDQVTSGGVLFFRIATGDSASSFIATESVCPHQGGALVWKATDNKIQCQLHFAEYDTAGSVLQGPQGSSGNTRMLRVYSKVIESGNLVATVS